jgi:hypothetical protein
MEKEVTKEIKGEGGRKGKKKKLNVLSIPLP